MGRGEFFARQIATLMSVLPDFGDENGIKTLTIVVLGKFPFGILLCVEFVFFGKRSTREASSRGTMRHYRSSN
jgi:hypothetical protein